MKSHVGRVIGGVLAVAALGLLGVAARQAAAASAPAAAGTLTVLNYDLQGRKGPLPVTQYEQLRALLLYLNPDIIAVHTVLKDAGVDRDKPLARAALALEMYYAYQPLTDMVGSALISRYPIREATCLYDQKTLATSGMQVSVQVGPRTYNVFVVRPPTGTVGRAATASLLPQTKALAGADYLVLASFSPKAGAKQMIAAWTKTGMFDPLAGAGPKALTFPYTKSAERADFVLLSAKLRTDYVGSEVVRNARLAGLSEHLPVLVTLRK